MASVLPSTTVVKTLYPLTNIYHGMHQSYDIAEILTVYIKEIASGWNVDRGEYCRLLTYFDRSCRR